MGAKSEETRCKDPGSFPSRITQDTFILPEQVMATCGNVANQRRLLENQHAEFLLRPDQTDRHPLLSMYQNSRLPEGKQKLSINHMVLYK